MFRRNFNCYIEEDEPSDFGIILEEDFDLLVVLNKIRSKEEEQRKRQEEINRKSYEEISDIVLKELNLEGLLNKIMRSRYNTGSDYVGLLYKLGLGDLNYVYHGRYDSDTTYHLDIQKIAVFLHGLHFRDA